MGDELGTYTRALQSLFARTTGKSKFGLERTEALLVQLKLQGDMHRKVTEIAYGRQRLVEIAIALALQPKVLLLDEPAAGIPSNELDLLHGAIEIGRASCRERVSSVV